MWKCKGLLFLLFSSTFLLFLPQPTHSAPIPNPEPLSPGIIIGAKAGALLVLKAILLSQYLSGEKAEPQSDYGVPSSGYGPPSYNPPPVITYDPPSYEAPSSAYGAPSSAYGAPSSSNGAPSSSYGAPSSSYGAPSSSYGAPSYEPVPSYKPTSSQG